LLKNLLQLGLQGQQLRGIGGSSGEAGGVGDGEKAAHKVGYRYGKGRRSGASVLECGSPLPLSSLTTVRRKSGRGLPHSKTCWQVGSFIHWSGKYSEDVAADQGLWFRRKMRGAGDAQGANGRGRKSGCITFKHG
jgi:hypothetical protein